MQWLMTSHVRRYHRHYHSSGHVWQGRFKAFPIQQDDHLLTVLRYVERNPVRRKDASDSQGTTLAVVVDWHAAQEHRATAAGSRSSASRQKLVALGQPAPN